MRTEETRLTETRETKIPSPKINVTPLVDVLLVLLIIFFVIQPQREAKFESHIPRKPDQEVEGTVPPRDLLMVDVKSGSGLDQLVELNSRPMSLAELGITLKGLLEQQSGKTVYVRAPTEKRYGEVVQVIDVIKGAGAELIGLQIDFLL
jgi:biopolymer transport protein ExbD